MYLLRCFVWSLLLAIGLCTAGAHAQSRVRIVSTWPAGDDVSLANGQNFYLRLAYDTDRPIHIWARPYFHGQPVNAGSNTSRSYQGEGEALGWFFLFDPDGQVDEVRVSAGDGRLAHTPVVAVWRGRIHAGSSSAAAGAEPGWVTSMLAANAQADRADAQRRANTPMSVGDMVFFNAFMLAVYGTALGALAWPAWALWKWRGLWRIAAGLPAVVMAFVVLRIMIDTGRDPTSHNLWPFEILMTGVPCVLVMLGLWIARRMLVAARTND